MIGDVLVNLLIFIAGFAVGASWMYNGWWTDKDDE